MVKQVIKNNMPWALVSGGSKGIGYAIANALAQRNYNLVLVARNEEDLQLAKNKLESRFAIQIEILSFDLSEMDSAAKIGAWSTERDLPLKMVCNVTGIGGSADYLSSSLT